MKPSPSSEYDEQDREIVELLKELGSFHSTYPSELLAARRATFAEQVERLSPVDLGEELSAEDQELVKLLGHLRSAPVEYPAELLAARRSAFLRQMERVRRPSLWGQFHGFLQRVFPSKTMTPSLSPAGFLRISVVIGTLIAAVFIGSLFFRRAEQLFQPSPSQPVVAPTHILPTSTGEVAITICKPEEQTFSCLLGELDSSQDLADTGNGLAWPAVSKDAHSNHEGVHKAAYVNDGRSGASWVSNSADSWIKIDLGQVRTINTVRLQKGNPAPSSEDTPGPFVIAVAVSDVYADGDSRNDSTEYAQVFRSEQTGFRGTVSPAETIRIQFPTVQARFVKITFEKEGAAIEEVGVFLSPPGLAKQATKTPQVPGITWTPIGTNTPSLMDTATPVPNGTGTVDPTLTNTPPPSGTPILPPTNTTSPTDTSIPVPTIPLPTIVPPTAIAPIVQPSPTSTGTILVTGNHQILTFICNGNAAEIRGHANTVTLLGSCSSITVTGNGNYVYWQSGSPVITNNGKDNIVQQL